MTHELSGARGDLQETGMSPPAQLARPNSSLWFILAWRLETVWAATITFHDQQGPPRLTSGQTVFIISYFVVGLQ